MNSNQITILIPCYNSENYINKCIDSCLKQTTSDFEILIVNDGSTDYSLDIIQKYLKVYSNIKLINQPNHGLAYTRNVLIKNMSTKYGYFLDADDWIENNCIEDLNKLISNQEFDIIVNSYFIDNAKKSKVFYISNKIDQATNKEHYLINNTLFAWGNLFRKDFVVQNDLWFNGNDQFFEDAGVMSYWVFKSTNFKAINKPVYHYVIRENSLSHNKIIEKDKIDSAINQLTFFYSLISREKEDKLQRCLNDQLCFYRCVIFTYIQFQSNLNRKQKKEYKLKLKRLEKDNYKLKYPKRYWKFWYFVLYRLFGY